MCKITSPSSSFKDCFSWEKKTVSYNSMHVTKCCTHTRLEWYMLLYPPIEELPSTKKLITSFLQICIDDSKHSYNESESRLYRYMYNYNRY